MPRGKMLWFSMAQNLGLQMYDCCGFHSGLLRDQVIDPTFLYDITVIDGYYLAFKGIVKTGL